MVGTHTLPGHLRRFFAPRAPLKYVPPIGRDPDVPLRSTHRGAPKLTGVASLVASLQAERDGAEEDTPAEAPPPLSAQEQFRLRQEAKRKAQEALVDTGRLNYAPQKDPNATADPYKTLFVGRLDYGTTEGDLRRTFEAYGPIESIRIVKHDGRSRGYAFILFEQEKDMAHACRDANGIRIRDRKIIVDVERGRTVKNWFPRRLGGGLGGRVKKLRRGLPVPVAAAPVTAIAPAAAVGRFAARPTRGFAPRSFDDRRGGRFDDRRGGGFNRDRNSDRGFDRAPDRGYDRAPDRGYGNRSAGASRDAGRDAGPSRDSATRDASSRFSPYRR